MTYTNAHGITYTFIGNLAQEYIGTCNGNCFGDDKTAGLAYGISDSSCPDPLCPNATGILYAADLDDGKCQ